MKKFIKIVGWTILCLILLFVGAGSLFIYKVKNGFPVSYETEKPTISFPDSTGAILVFSKTTGFRHAESIEASKPIFSEIAKRKGWFLHETEEGGVFNAEQLAHVDVVIFNNTTGRLLDETQQAALQSYVENGGTLIGIHGAGDNSHHWPWYEANLIGAEFSHHPLEPQFQTTSVIRDEGTDTTLTQGIPAQWTSTDEWYVFYKQPSNAKILFHIQGDKILPSGNMLWMKDKNFGMGKFHPVAWQKTVGKGRSFYTSMGHSKEVWGHCEFVRMIENAMEWGINN
jgi:type 1 glutamine amidotransferase